MANRLLPVLALLSVLEWGFVISVRASVVSVTGTGYSHRRFLRQMCDWEPVLRHTQIHTHTLTHSQKECQRSVKKKTTYHLLRNNVTPERIVYWYIWQVRQANGRMKKKFTNCVSTEWQSCLHKISYTWPHFHVLAKWIGSTQHFSILLLTVWILQLVALLLQFSLTRIIKNTERQQPSCAHTEALSDPDGCFVPISTSQTRQAKSYKWYCNKCSTVEPTAKVVANVWMTRNS